METRKSIMLCDDRIAYNIVLTPKNNNINDRCTSGERCHTIKVVKRKLRV